MTLPDELECLAQVQMASANQISTQFRIARPPKTESLPLISGNVGMFRGQPGLLEQAVQHAPAEGAVAVLVNAAACWLIQVPACARLFSALQ